MTLAVNGKTVEGARASALRPSILGLWSVVRAAEFERLSAAGW
jgi:hypothetical protein